MSINISASLIKDYLICQKQVYYRINNPEFTQTEDLLVGTLVHDSIEKYWKSRELASEYSREAGLSYRLSLEATNKIKRCLDIFYTHYSWLLSDTDKIEQRFKIPLGKDIFLVGKIDRIFDQSIVDWKTSYHTPKTISNDPQFILYSYAYRHMFNKEPKKIMLVSLFANKVVTYDEDKDLTNSLLHDIIPSIIESIRKNTLPRTGLYREGVCKNCKYINSCYKDIENELESSETTN